MRRLLFPILGVVTCCLAPAAQGRVNPLTIIKRQIHKPNMLVVLDTSGSMTGVPGDEFVFHSTTNRYDIEVGVDCDNGNNCQAATIRGRCASGAAPCWANGDCPGGSCNASLVPEPLGMCRISQSICGAAGDCPQVGDSCGPPSSRAVLAKRVLGRIITDNYKIVNLGLMTFYETGYFPYFRVVSAGASAPEKRYFGVGMDDAISNCFDLHHGPKPTCTYQGVTYTLSPAPNSRYEVNERGRKTYHDMNFCGQWCTVPGIGLGKWRGSYYFGNSSGDTVTTDKVIQPVYSGKNIMVGGFYYRYFDPRNDYYNYNASHSTNIIPPIETSSCHNNCGATCGGRWDQQLAPFLNPRATAAEATSGAQQILTWMESAAEGGLMMYGGTPSGCTLENSVAKTPNSSAYDYMVKVKDDDDLKCRPSFVLFITDGEANGPGDSGCDSAACAAADPAAAGCNCRAVKAAWHLRNNDHGAGEKLGVRTFVVGFAKDATQGVVKTINDNIARAGGTEHAYAATNERELETAIQSAIYEAVKGSYATSPATSSSGTQLPLTIQGGKYVLDSRVDFPSWQGHLLAYDVTTDPPTLAWDAGTQLAAMNWWERRVYVGTAAGATIRIEVDPRTKAVLNKSTLAALGLGTNPDEAESAARFTLGDPTFKNPAILGAIVNSTPIDVGQPGDNPLPGGHEFFLNYRNRPNLTYVGSDDGMLHAFFTNATTVGTKAYPAGSEAFAYIPYDLLPNVSRIYAQGGQVADPERHIFGVANSPKVKNLCIRSCTDAQAAIWKTLLVMPEGYASHETFVLDITNPVSDLGFADPPVAPLWDTEDAFIKGAYDDALGVTLSVPGFFYNKTDSLDDHRLIFASGYKDEDGSANQGRQLVIASATTGAIFDRKTIRPAGTCAQEYALLADVATARDYTKDQRQKLLGAYVGDTWGGLWRYAGGEVNRIASFGCEDPLHFAPTVVQLDRDDSANFSRETYLVQVTNSAMDEDTIDLPTPSKMVIMKEKVDDAGLPIPDPSFGVAGKITVTTGTAQMCGNTDPSGHCAEPIPASARPMGTPMALLKRDGSGFLLLSLWYLPDSQGCTKGRTYLALHEVAHGSLAQKQGLILAAQEPIASAIVVSGHMYVVSSQGLVDIAAAINATFVTGSAQSPRSGVGAGRYNLSGWTEL